jgi:spermidine synthase
VHVINDDAFVWLKKEKSQFDFIVVDFPDPSNYSLGKLYSNSFYRELSKVLTPGGCVVIQSTSPYVARKSFWIINKTLQHVGFNTLPYHCYIPSFGEWGYVLAFHDWHDTMQYLPGGLKFITPQSFIQLKAFPPDMNEVDAEVNSLNNQILVHTFEKEWADYTR